MATLRPFTLQYPGSWGLNTQEDTRTEDESRFAATATNGVVDSTGKLTSREDFTLTTGSFSNTLESLFVWRQTDASEVVLSAGAGHVYSGTSTLTSRVDYSNATIASNSWQFAALGSNVMMVQDGVTPHLIHEDWTSVGFSGATFTNPNVCMTAFGRLWAADDATGGIRDTIWWSNLLDGHNWGSGDAGSIDLTNAWPKGKDRVVALAAMGNRIIVFGRKSILLYTMPDGHDPASMALAADDVIVNVGCVCRDSVQVTDEGVFFLSDNGVFKIDRLAQTTALLTHQHVSKMVNDDVLTQIAAQTNLTLIRSAYYPTEGWYVLSFPTPNVSFCVHMRRPVPEQEGALVTTRWTNAGWAFTSFDVDSSDTWYMGGKNGIHTYSGYTPDGTSQAYTLSFAPQWLTFGDDTVVKHMKKLVMVLETSSGQTGTVTWSVDYINGTTRSESFTCDTTEFAENPGVGRASVPLGDSCNVIKPTVAFAINGNQVTLHQMSLYATPGAVKPLG